MISVEVCSVNGRPMASTPVTASGTACTILVLRRFLSSGPPVTTGAAISCGLSVVLWLISSIARFKLPGAFVAFGLLAAPASLPCGHAPRSKPINVWIRVQRTKYQIRCYPPASARAVSTDIARKELLRWIESEL
jgi:hypothetical protein